MTDEEARTALHEYEEIQDTIREFEDEKRWVLERLRAWLRQRRYRTEIHASEVVFLDSRGGNGGRDNGAASEVEQEAAASPF